MPTKPKRKAKPRAPRTVTQVADRHPEVPLWREAAVALRWLRACGADPSRVPKDLRDASARDRWLTEDTGHARVPLAHLDYTSAILEAITSREVRPSGAHPDPGLAVMEAWKLFSISTADAARLTARGEAWRRERETGEHMRVITDEMTPAEIKRMNQSMIEAEETVEARAQNLMRKAHRRRKCP